MIAHEEDPTPHLPTPCLLGGDRYSPAVLRRILSARFLIALGAVLILSACGQETPPEGAQEEAPQEVQETSEEAQPETPKEACERGEVPVFTKEAWYQEFESPEQTFTGPLAFVPPYEMAGGRYRAFNVGETAVYGGPDETIDLMKVWVGKTVRIQGKLVDLGFGPEIWPGTITCATEAEPTP
jgi:hypothetical protein